MDRSAVQIDSTSDGTGRHRGLIRGVPIDLIDCDQAIARVHTWRQRGLRRYVCFVNPHSVQLCQKDPHLMVATHSSGLALPDGIGVVLAAKILGLPDRGRVTGPSFMLRFCQWGTERGYRHFFYGGVDGVPNGLAEHLCEMFPGMEVAGAYSPPFRRLTPRQRRTAVEMINESRADVLWVGLGAPKQEKWMLENCGLIDVPIMLGVGAAFDFHSGNVSWAPGFVRKAGMEWAYRLAQNPVRMWRRNFNNAMFLAGVLRRRKRDRRRAASRVCI